MTVSSGFFNSVNHDRLYDAEQVSSMFDGMIIDGVYENYGEAFMITAYPDSNSAVMIGTGRAWFDHTWILNDSQYLLTLDPPNELLGRIDAIVLDIDKRTDVRKNSIVYIRGTEAVQPANPVLIKEDLHTQYPLCYITRNAEIDAPISQSDINIRVGKSDCPFVVGVLEAQNLENLMAQLDSEFNEWWDGIKATLDDNVVTNLQQQIDELKEKVDSDSALVGLLTKPVYDKFKTGDFGITYKKTDLTIKLNNFDDLWDGTKPDEYALGKYPYAFLLPDGKVFAMAVGHGGSNGHHYDVGMFLQNTDGVVTSKYLDINKEDNRAHPVVYPDNGIDFLGGELDSYPVTCFMSCLGDRDGGRGVLIKATIYESGTMGYDIQDITFSGMESDYGHGPIMESPSASGAYITTFWNCESPYDLGILKVDSSGTYTTKVSRTPIPNPRNQGSSTTNKNSGPYDCLFGDTGFWILRAGYQFVSDPGNIDDMRPTEFKYIKINETDLSVESLDSGPDSSIEYYPKYQFSVYSLSESGGLETSTIEPGKTLTPTKSKLLDYFVGASNSGESIPEGSYLATKIGNSYYGVGPKSEYIGIGENGGAAILKKKASSNSTIDINKAVTYMPGMVETSSGTYYLLYETCFENHPGSSKSIPLVHRIYIGG